MSNQLSDKINRQLLNDSNLAFICVDRSLRVIESSQNLPDYGFKQPRQGDDVTDYVDLLVGVDPDQELSLPVVSSPSGQAVSIKLMPETDCLMVVVSDATLQLQQQQLLQQKANENQLLLDRQQILMQDLQKAEQELREKNRLLEEASRLQTGFLSGVSHEFRTPLSSILGYSEILQKTVGARHKSSQRYLSAVQRSGKHLLSLVENLLDHGRLDANEIVLQPTAVDLRTLFDDVSSLLSPLAKTKHISLKIDLASGAGKRVLLDDSRLRQCLINLIGNAIKFTDQGGVTVTATWQAEKLSVSIEDTGIGIRAEDLDKIRQPFWQAKDTGKAGTGLGLAITERIIDMMGGSMTISSTFGSGTTIGLEVIAPIIEQREGEVDLAQQSKFSQPISILLAEDDYDIASLMTILLDEAGARVLHVDNGELALQAIATENIDLVLMDIHMPVMDGYQVIEALRAQNNHVPVVVMTASSIDIDRSRAEQLGCDGYLVKPITVTDIIDISNHVLSDRAV